MREDKLKSFDDDIYNRKVIAENLTKIIEVQEEPMVISLDSEWGTGKTTFVTMWKDLLDNDEKYSSKFNTLYFNAWENDYITDPLLALVSEIEAEIKREDSKFKKNFNKVKQVILPMAKLVTKVGVKVGTAGVLDLDKVNLGDYIEDTIMDLASKLGEFSIKEIVASKSIRTKFKEVMSEYQKENGKKIIFFIDELDRCRPTFAIELLEVIKHLFNIDNCIFIISIDKDQLSHSVSTIYGQNMDTIGYLRRFFDLDYRLPKLDVHMYMDNRNEVVLKGYYNVELFKMLLKEVFINEQFSLRDIDKAHYYIKLLLPLVTEFNKDSKYNSVYIATISYLYAILIAMKIKKTVLYRKIIDGEYNVEEILKDINIVNLDHYKEVRIGGWHNKPLQEVIKPALEIFLKVNLKYKKEGYIYCSEEYQYAVGIKNTNGGFGWDNVFEMEYLFNDKKLNIIDKLEFIEAFSNQCIGGSE